ncbi:MAG: aldehyde dehydrogenase family protein [Novosphingobium sp.]|nr:aldehyde dehydrogenase family protein [Novosphingobium sp.]MCP5404003.1 aldehyde dehydrogenase family protein [Novosphingobium sp.]
MTEKLTLTIGGKPVDTKARLEVRNPASGDVFADVPDAGRAELDQAVAAARAAFAGWRDTPWAERQALVSRIGDVLKENAEELARMLTREQGKPTAQALGELSGAAGWCKATASLDLPDRVIEDNDSRYCVTRYEPIGIVGGISPWNFPVLLSTWKIAAALVTGNTLVLKPSPFTPMTVLRLGELLRDVVPPGVLNVISGGDALGPMMTEHPGIGKISFTGSSATGRKVMASAAGNLKRLTLELGGNDAAIVFPDVDVEATAKKLFWSAFSNSGQVCIATKRAYVHDDIFEPMVSALTALVRSTPMGDGSQQGNALGPIQNQPQLERVRELVDASQQAGDTLVQGKAPADGGYFVPLTLVVEPQEDSPIVVKEQFGPVLPLLRFSDEDDVVARANRSDMGLAATVWTADEDRGLRIAGKLETGSVWINESMAISPLAPFGGRKQSGVGVENGIEGLMAYTEPKTISIKRSPP